MVIILLAIKRSLGLDKTKVVVLVVILVIILLGYL